VKFRFDLELFADELVEVARSQKPLNPSIWGFVEHHQMRSSLAVTIPRSVWVEQILPGTEFGKVHIIELSAIPIESCAGVKSSFEALQQALKLESQGF